MGREGAYTTVLKLLQIMTEKGLVRRDERARTHVYQATASADQTQQQLVTDLVDNQRGPVDVVVIDAVEPPTEN
jgi:predicted transcriptional regulator